MVPIEHRVIGSRNDGGWLKLNSPLIYMTMECAPWVEPREPEKLMRSMVPKRKSGRISALEIEMLIVLSGLPGTGKTTIGKALVDRLSAAYVRIDEIEHALRQHFGIDREIGAAGYAVGFAIASSNLKRGNLVVADSVNPVPESRQGWRDAARAIEGARVIEVEIICSDEDEHRRRVEERVPDINGFTLPMWSSVISHDYVPWLEPRLIVDTAIVNISDAVSMIERQLELMTEDRHPPR